MIPGFLWCNIFGFFTDDSGKLTFLVKVLAIFRFDYYSPVTVEGGDGLHKVGWVGRRLGFIAGFNSSGCVG